MNRLTKRDLRWSTLIFLLFFSLSSFADTLRYGYDITQYARFNKKDVELTLSIWMKEIIKGTGHDIEPIAYDDIYLMSKAFEEGSLDYVSTSALNFVKFFDRSRLADGFAKSDDFSDKSRLQIVIRKGSSIKAWEDLSGKKVMGVKESDVSRLYVDTMLLERDLSNDLHWIDTKSHQQSLLKLFFGKADAAIVTQKAFSLAAEMNPQMSQKLKVFDKSTMQELIPSYFRKGIDDDLRQTIINIVSSFSNSVRGKQLMVVFQSDSFSSVSADDLLPVAEAYDNYLRLLKKQERTAP